MKIYVCREIRNGVEYELVIYITPTNEAIIIGDNEISNVRVDKFNPYVEGDTIAINTVTNREHRTESMYVTMSGEYTDTDEGILDALFHVLEAYGYSDGELEELF